MSCQETVFCCLNWRLKMPYKTSKRPFCDCITANQMYVKMVNKKLIASKGDVWQK